MPKRLTQSALLRNIFIFTVSTVINKGMNFFLLPVLTHYLTQEDYGMLGLITSVSTISLIYIGFFPTNFVMVKYSALGKEAMSRYLFNIFILIFITFFLVFGVLFALKGALFSHYDDRVYLVFYIVLLCLFQVVWQILSTVIQLEKDAFFYAWLQFIQVALTLGLALLLIIEFSWGWEGKFFAEFTVFMLSCGYALYYLFKNGYISFDVEMQKLKTLFGYLFPLTFFVLGLYLLGTVDKIFIANMIGLEAAGIYAISITLTIIVNIIFDAVLKAWEPHMYELLGANSHESRSKVVMATYGYWLFVVVFASLYTLFVPYLFSFMIDEKFKDALLYVPLLVAAYSFEGLRKPISGFLNHIDKVNTNAIMTTVAALLNIVLLYLLIPHFGLFGAVYAVLASFALLFVMNIWAVLRTCQLPWLLQRD